MNTPASIAAALAQIERAEKQSRILSVIFAVIVSAAPIGLFFARTGLGMMNVVLITLISYNTLLLFWVKRDVSTSAARVLRAIQDTAEPSSLS
jgi:hypothetical protein